MPLDDLIAAGRRLEVARIKLKAAARNFHKDPTDENRQAYSTATYARIDAERELQDKAVIAGINPDWFNFSASSPPTRKGPAQ